MFSLFLNFKNSNASKNIEKFFSQLNLSWFWRSKSLLLKTTSQNLLYDFCSPFYSTLNIRIKYQNVRISWILSFNSKSNKRIKKKKKRILQQDLRGKGKTSTFYIVIDLVKNHWKKFFNDHYLSFKFV